MPKVQVVRRLTQHQTNLLEALVSGGIIEVTPVRCRYRETKTATFQTANREAVASLAKNGLTEPRALAGSVFHTVTEAGREAHRQGKFWVWREPREAVTEAGRAVLFALWKGGTLRRTWFEFELVPPDTLATQPRVLNTLRDAGLIEYAEQRAVEPFGPGDWPLVLTPEGRSLAETMFAPADEATHAFELGDPVG